MGGGAEWFKASRDEILAIYVDALGWFTPSNLKASLYDGLS
jgi:hypothetical protein